MDFAVPSLTRSLKQDRVHKPVDPGISSDRRTSLTSNLCFQEKRSGLGNKTKRNDPLYCKIWIPSLKSLYGVLDRAEVAWLFRSFKQKKRSIFWELSAVTIVNHRYFVHLCKFESFNDYFTISTNPGGIKRWPAWNKLHQSWIIWIKFHGRHSLFHDWLFCLLTSQAFYERPPKGEETEEQCALLKQRAGWGSYNLGQNKWKT